MAEDSTTKKDSNTGKIRVIYFGTPDFAVPALQALHESSEVEVCAVVTQPDREAGRGQKVTACPVKKYAAASNLPVLQPDSIKKELTDFLGKLNNLGKIDIGIVAAFGQILPQKILDFPEKGCLNIHASLLPRWRGAAPIHRAIITGDSATGVCLMKMEAGLDTGPVYFRQETKIGSDDTLLTMHDRLAELGARTLLDNLEGILSGQLNCVPQPEDGITYASKIKNEEAEIDWSLSAQETARLIRALNPFPGAFTSCQGKRLKVFKAEIRQNSLGTPGKPGQVLFCDKEILEVQCGNQILCLKELQLAGKKRMPVADFLRGVDISKGLILGDRENE